MGKKKAKTSQSCIVDNRKARHDYIIEERFEAGLVLTGWEIKSLRAGRAQLKDSYVHVRQGEAYLVGAHISPLLSASTHVEANPTRRRKLLLHKRQLHKLIGAVQQSGRTVVALNLHWSKQYAKCDIALAQGKKLHDKRDSLKSRDWDRTRARIMKSNNRS